MENCTKIMLIIFNWILLLIGIGIILSGLLIEANNLDYIEKFKSEIGNFNDFPNIKLIIIGSIISLLSLYGFCGISTKNTFCLIIYVVANLLMIVGLIVTTTIAYYNFKAVTPDEAEKFIVLRFNSDKYNNDNNTKSFIDEFQTLQQCCGNEGKKNYIDDGNFPQSCCSQDDFDRQTCYKNSYKMGCVTKIPEMMQELNAIIYNKYSERKVLLTAAIVIGINEFLSVVLALKLAQSIARNRRRSYVA